jgi:ferritin-like protein
VREEMLHMLLAGNLLKAIGGHPRINSPEFVRTYPGHLPGISSDLEVTLERYSESQVENKFMKIEEPEKVLNFPIKHFEAFAPARTIGEFYRQIREVFAAGGDSLIIVKDGQPSSSLFSVPQTITTAAEATAAIDLIVTQGEGTSSSPFFPDGDNNPANDRLAHYYKFAELVRGRIKRNQNPPPNPTPEDLYFYDANDRVPFNAALVLPVRANPRASDFAEGSAARVAIDRFNRTYTRMLGLLDAAFNVDPDRLDDAIGVMKPDLRNAAQTLMAIPLDDGSRPGPSFEYLP